MLRVRSQMNWKNSLMSIVMPSGELKTRSAQKSLNAKQLDQARAAARWKVDKAVSLYRQLFEGKPLTGSIALEFYQTLGGTPTFRMRRGTGWAPTPMSLGNHC